MKKIVLLTSILGLLSLNALELDIDAGAGLHFAGAKGNLIYQKETWKNSSAIIEHGATTNFYAWTEINSDIKYAPTLRLEISRNSTLGKSLVHIDAGQTINNIIDYIEQKIPLVTINDKYYNSRLIMNTYEAFAYYEYFKESGYPTVGVGAGVKVFEFDYSATIIDGLEFNDNGGDSVPMVFLKSRYELMDKDEELQVGVQGDLKMLVFADSNIYDYVVKMDMMMQYNETTDLGLEFGYRDTYFNIKGEDIAKVGGSMDNVGVFVGFVGHFR